MNYAMRKSVLNGTRVKAKLPDSALSTLCRTHQADGGKFEICSKLTVEFCRATYTIIVSPGVL
jgi:hypothetical protein